MAMPERPKVAMGENLLESTLPDFDAQRGDWKLSNGSLISPPVTGARLVLPVDPPPRYALSLLVERIEGPSDFLVSLPIGGQTGTVEVDFAGRSSGIDTLDWQRPEQNPTRHDGQVLLPGKTVQLDYIVTPDSIRVLADGSPIVDWKGDPRRLTPSPAFIHLALSADERARLGIGAWGTQFKVSQAVLRPHAVPNETPPRLVQTHREKLRTTEVSTSSSGKPLTVPKASPSANKPLGEVR
jgi:hypothetical protein